MTVDCVQCMLYKVIRLVPRQPASFFSLVQGTGETKDEGVVELISALTHTHTRALTHTGMQIVRRSRKTMMFVLLVWRETY